MPVYQAVISQHFLQISLCLKSSLKEEKYPLRKERSSLYCVQTSCFLFVGMWRVCKSSKKHPKGPKGDPGPLPIFQDVLLLSNHTPGNICPNLRIKTDGVFSSFHCIINTKNEFRKWISAAIQFKFVMTSTISKRKNYGMSDRILSDRILLDYNSVIL